MDRPIDFGRDAANPSGAPEAGGATTWASRFGGDSLEAHFLRFVARIARDIEAGAYRRLRDLEQRSQQRGAAPHPGAPRRSRGVGNGPH
jgi:hypothetical protein